MIRILIVDHQGLMLEGLRTILDLEDDFMVVGMAKTAEEAIPVCETVEPDVVVMDMQRPASESAAAIESMKKRFPDVKILALSSFNDDECVLGAVMAGADGYLLKDYPSEELIRGIRTAMEGHDALAPPAATRVIRHLRRLVANEQRQPQVSPALEHGLTDREGEVMRLVSQGLSNREISQALFVTEGTIKNHVSSICQKIGARDRTQIAVFAWRNCLLSE